MNLCEANKNAKEIYKLIKKGVSPEESGFYVLQGYVAKNLDKKVHRLLSKLKVDKDLSQLISDFSSNKLSFYVDDKTNQTMYSYKGKNYPFSPKSIDDYLEEKLNIGSHLKFYPVLKMYFSQEKYLSILMVANLK